MSPDADLTYRALLQPEPRDAADLARELGMSRPRVQAAVDELVALGAVSAEPGALQPAPVDVVLTRLRRPRRAPVAERAGEQWRRHVAAVDGLGSLAAASVRRWSRASARRRAAQLVEIEQYEHLAINTEEVFTAESLSAARPLDRALIDRGVRTLVLERPPLDGDRGVPARSVADIPEGAYRQADDVPLKLMVFDRRVAFFPADPLNFEHGYVEVADPVAVARCCALFSRLWAAGHDPFRRGVAPVEVSERERRLLSLLAAGHTDISAAAGLGISPRAVSYTMRALMDRAGVDNRFQLGLLLGATGTVRPDFYQRD
ncbi:helix-turn-helix transcriptional regulator [Actinoplanes sp. TFC3]|uniref:helix-turn-helix transcriptional regulator n=1 Tax=Actinoplanes sp. TFC3 TaxID=1710355 RepID=UPI00137A037E|nr:helix-turn-helix transcriptional regulator [Actinoplanes sp. TFC3]